MWDEESQHYNAGQNLRKQKCSSVILIIAKLIQATNLAR